MYIEGSWQYKYQLKHDSPPSKFGYKDIIPLWTAEKWAPQPLIRRHKKAGAKYFVALRCHHDNIACWNSKNHRWNSVNFGPKTDIVGLWRRAALQEGLRFGVTEHIAYSWNWFNVNKGADRTGPYAGVLYDGNDSRNQDFYQEAHDEKVPHYPVHLSEVFKQRQFDRVSDLVAQHEPDLLVTDGGVPFGKYGIRLGQFLQPEHGTARREAAVYNIMNQKDPVRYGDFRGGIAVEDIERSVVNGIPYEPWQCDTCVGD